MAGSSYLVVEGISKRYSRKLAVDDVSFTITRGEVVGFVGPNGAGKSTVMKVICGLVRPDSGSVSLDSIQLAKEPAAFLSQVGAMLDGPGRYPSLTAWQHLAYLTRMRGCFDPAVIESTLLMVGLEPRSRKRARHFSSGMKQRLGIAMAIVHSPRLLILDEPMNGIDPAGIVELRGLIRSFSRDAGVTIFISSHILSEIEQVCDRVLFLRSGKLVREKLIGNEDQQGCHILVRTGNNPEAHELLTREHFVWEIRPVEGGLVCRIDPRERQRIAEVLVLGKIPVYEMTEWRESLEQLYLSDYTETGSDVS